MWGYTVKISGFVITAVVERVGSIYRIKVLLDDSVMSLEHHADSRRAKEIAKELVESAKKAVQKYW